MNWLLLRGLARESRHWYKFPDHLHKIDETQNVFALDYLGVGSKNQKSSPLKISAYVDELREEWLELKGKYSGPWGVIGISMGAMMALDWCDRFEDDFENLIVMNTSTRDTANIFNRLSIEAIGTFSKLIFNKDTRDREKKALSLTVKMKELPDDLLDAYAEFFDDKPLKRTNFLRQVFAASHYTLPKSIKAKTLVLAGKEDKLAHYKCSQEISKKLNVPLELHEQAGHDLPIDDPDWIINMMKKHYFLSK